MLLLINRNGDKLAKTPAKLPEIIVVNGQHFLLNQWMLLQTLKQTHQFGVGVIYWNSLFAETILLAKCHGCLEHITISLPAIGNTKFGLPLNGNAEQAIF